MRVCFPKTGTVAPANSNSAPINKNEFLEKQICPVCEASTARLTIEIIFVVGAAINKNNFGDFIHALVYKSAIILFAACNFFDLRFLSKNYEKLSG